MAKTPFSASSDVLAARRPASARDGSAAPPLGGSSRDAAYRDTSGDVLERITVETALYAAVFGVALFLRLFRLGLAPMSEGEAAQALAALSGAFLPAGGSPFLYSVNAFLFSLFSASDALARLVPALAGSLVVLVPALFRDELGRFGALGASIALAISPVALVASRSLDGEVIVVAGVLALIALARRYAATADRRNLIGAAIALGVGLASGSGMYTALVAFVVSAIVLRFALGRESQADAEGQRLEGRQPSPPLRFGDVREIPPTSPSSLWRAMLEAPHRARIAGSLLVVFIVAATGGLAHPAGLAAAGDLLTAWLNAFGAANGSTAVDVVQILLVYETLIVSVGVIGLARVLLEGRHLEMPPTEMSPPGSSSPVFGAWLGFAAIISLAIIILQPGRRPIDLLLPVTLLALLAGYAIQPWAEAVKSKASLTADGVVLVVGLTLITFVVLQVTAYVRGRFPPLSIGSLVLPAEIALVSLILLLVGVIGALLALMVEARTALRAGATLGLVVLALGTFSASWGATQERVGDPREIILGPSVTSTDVRNLVEAAEQIAIRAQGHLAALPIRLEVDDPVVGWYLRDARVTGGGAPAGVVTRPDAQPQASEGGYVGARFYTRTAWDALGLSLDAWLDWALFRTSETRPVQMTQAVRLWEKR